MSMMPKAPDQPYLRGARLLTAGSSSDRTTYLLDSTRRMATYLSHRTRDRARATYRATSHLEGDKSWSEFVERAILAEVERREITHNAGERYQADSSPLPAGRPLG